MKQYETIIIGSGFSGMAAAIYLQRENKNDFLILERDSQLGGTWWKNAYPGAAVDVQSYLYSLSFEDYDWSRLFAPQEELLNYTNHLIEKYGIAQKAKINAGVGSLEYDEVAFKWKVSTVDGTVYFAKNVINASGGLSHIKIPDFEGRDTFQGMTMHTSEWNHDYDYADKKIAIIGTGASAVQAIPELAKKAKHLSVFQRTPHWILPRPDRKLSNFERKLHKRMPFLRKAHRAFLYLKFESRLLAFRFFPKTLTKLPQWEANKHIKKYIKDEALRKQLTPDYTIGCKRVLVSNDYYPTYTRSNVQLYPKEAGIASFYEKGIKTTDNQQIEVDMIVYATGFHASENVIAYPIIGRGGRTLEEEWETGAHAYLGTTVPNFPNLYLLGGPNTGIGHTSFLVMLEAQLEYVFKLLRKKWQDNLNAIEIKASVEKEYNETLQNALSKTVWQRGGCQSWYQTANGKNTTLYPDFTFKFRKDCVNAKLEDHIF